MKYAHPEYLVNTEWVAAHLTDPTVRMIESDEDALLYPIGHIPGAVQVDWFSTLQHPLRRNFLTKEQFEKVCSKLGIDNNTVVVFYGDKSNWFACYAFWLFQYYGHQNVKIMNGGRAKWELEQRPLVKEVPAYTETVYRAKEADQSIRAFRDEVFVQVEKQKPLVDVRSPKEYTGELLHMPNYPQEARRAEDISPARSASRGRRQSTKRTARSSRPRSWSRYIRARASSLRARSSPIAASGNVRH